MESPSLPYLRKLLGDAWIDAELFGERPSHLLGQWHKKDPSNLLVSYAETLVKKMLTADTMTFNHEVLANKLRSKDDFVSTLAEVEVAILLGEQGFRVTLEPLAPQKGPDLRADWDSVPYFVEIRTVGFSKDEERREAVCNEIFAKLNTVSSSYHVALTVGDEYKPSSAKLREGIQAVVDCLDELKQWNAKEATLYYANEHGALLLFPDSAIDGTAAAIQNQAKFVARFEHLGKEHPGTSASFVEPRRNPAEPVKDHERLRKILDDKRDQLPKGSRGIIVLEVSELFMLSDFSIERALYGDLCAHFPIAKGPREEIDETTWSRNTRGFLLHTSRVSAVVIQKRTVADGEIKNEWHVYPTNRANEDTIKLTLPELQRFGDVGDRQHLSAENVR